MTRRRRYTGLRRIERDTYKINRAEGDVLAFERGGVLGLAKRLVRRPVRRYVGRKTKGWL